MSMMRCSTCHFDVANCTTAKSMPELIEVRPMKERGAARIDERRSAAPLRPTIR
jgi:hypothetical protein